ncbi:MAG TPA: signal peptidase II [Acidimicrobiales bacterium]|nr:signal peptidase II [Acidimicrobiales bacterium]
MQERRAAPPLSGGVARRPPAWRRPLVAAAVAAVVVTADQVTKTWAVHRLSQGPIHVVWKLDLILSFNTGSSFGLAQGWAPVFGGIAAVFIVVLLGALRHVHRTGLAVALGLVLGGAAGNLCDRIFRGHHGAVVDFVALHFWPTFNVADSSIVIGVALAAVLIWRSGIPEAAP